MKNFIKRITNYEFANDEFRISLVLFISALIFSILESVTNIAWLSIPTAGAGILCIVLFFAGIMREDSYKKAENG